MPEFEYDLAIVGSGPAGHRAAIQGAKLRKRVIVIERNPIIGGVCVNTGTIPSKTLREAVLYLSGYREHSMYGASYRVKERITLADLLFRVDGVVRQAHLECKRQRAHFASPVLARSIVGPALLPANPPHWMSLRG